MLYPLNTRVCIIDSRHTGRVVGTAVQHTDNPAAVLMQHPEPLMLVLLDRPIDVDPDCCIRVMVAHPDNLTVDG